MPRRWRRPPQALARTASGEAAADRGTVRVTASDVIGCEVLPPILAGVPRRACRHRDRARAHQPHRGSRRAATPTSPCAWCARRRAGSSRDVSARLSRVRLYARRDYLAQLSEPRSLTQLHNGLRDQLRPRRPHLSRRQRLRQERAAGGLRLAAATTTSLCSPRCGPASTWAGLSGRRFTHIRPILFRCCRNVIRYAMKVSAGGARGL